MEEQVQGTICSSSFHLLIWEARRGRIATKEEKQQRGKQRRLQEGLSTLSHQENEYKLSHGTGSLVPW